MIHRSIEIKRYIEIDQHYMNILLHSYYFLPTPAHLHFGFEGQDEEVNAHNVHLY